ncbi:hypothetical protein DAI22_04g284918 [Oryza sativa Japonica Group]|nr:hypothetical protein DAI22_04g284918 [Oryza sativa Japonica Group]
MSLSTSGLLTTKLGWRMQLFNFGMRGIRKVHASKKKNDWS